MAYLVAAPVMADGVLVTFQDGNPNDQVIIYNTGCPLLDAVVVIDLRPSVAGIIFDTVRGGPGANDPGNITVQSGDATIFPINDGDQVLHIQIGSLPQLGSVQVFMDVDDTQNGDQIYVDGSEMAGAIVTLSVGQQSTQAVIADDGRATLDQPVGVDGCLIS